MISEFSAVFSTSSTDLIISHEIDDYAERANLFGTQDYYFQQAALVGTSESSLAPFEINFKDSCQTATIISQELEVF